MEAQPIVALIATFNEEDIIGEAIAHLVAQGVSVYLIDNHSTDGTVREASRFLERGVIGIETFPKKKPKEFDWSSLLRRKEELAKELPASWFIHNDADEFRDSLMANTTLAQAIRDVGEAGYNAIDFAVYNFWPTLDDGPLGDGVANALLYCEPSSSKWAFKQVKCWRNLGVPIDLVSSGGHDVAFDGRRVFPVRFPVRHYPIRSNEHGQRKVFAERKARFSAKERARSWHIQYDEFREGCDFLRDPANLVRYRADAVRFELMARSQLVEATEAELRQVHREAAESQEALRGELARAREAQAQAQTELERARRDAGRWEEDRGTARAELVGVQAELKQSRTEAASSLGRLAQLQDELARLASDLTIARETASRGAVAEGALDQLLELRRDELAQLARLRQELQEAQIALGKPASELAAARDELAATRDELAVSRNELAATRGGLAEATAQREESARELAVVKATLGELRAVRDEESERHESERVRAVLEHETSLAARKQRHAAELAALERVVAATEEERERERAAAEAAGAALVALRQLHTRHVEELSAAQRAGLEELSAAHQVALEELSAAHQVGLEELNAAHREELAELRRSQALLVEQLLEQVRAAHHAERAQIADRHAVEIAGRERASEEELLRLRQVQAAQLAQKEGDIARYRDTLESRTGELRTVEAELLRLQGELNTAQSEIAHLCEDLNRVFTSRSWRVSALGREAWRLLGRS
jgi:hypothetical protein